MILVSVAPAIVDVVVAQDKVPLPAVDNTWLAVPSAFGSVHVTFEAIVSAAFNAT